MNTKSIDRAEQDIMRNWGSERHPLVSVCCTTYNHENYIGEAIDSFLMQETGFPFEVIVRDDCSTDKTAMIIRAYVERYPNIVKPIYEAENQYSKGVYRGSFMLKKAMGKYIALCDGDDYWISADKLQKQVELLEKYPSAVISVAHTDRYNCDDGDMTCFARRLGPKEELLGFREIDQHYYHTSTYVIKSTVYKEICDKYFSGNVRSGDTAMRAILITYGPFVLLPEVVSVYRRTGGGIWTSASHEKQGELELELAEKLAKILTGKHRRKQEHRAFIFARRLFRLRIRDGRTLASMLPLIKVFLYGIRKMPGYIWRKLTSASEKPFNTG